MLLKNLSNLRVGRKYRMMNFGEESIFRVEKPVPGDVEDYFIVDMVSLEERRFSDLVAYGRGRDFEVEDLGYG